MIKSALTISCFLMMSSLSVLNTQATQIQLTELNTKTRLLSAEEMIFQSNEAPKRIMNDNEQPKDKMCLWNDKINRSAKNR